MTEKNLEDYEAANETAARIDAMVELAKEKGLIVGGLDVATDRIELPVLGWEFAGDDALSLEALRKDAERYRWLRQRLVGVLQDWDNRGKGVLGLSFMIPGEVWFGCDENIDGAMVEVEKR